MSTYYYYFASTANNRHYEALSFQVVHPLSLSLVSVHLLLLDL